MKEMKVKVTTIVEIDGVVISEEDIIIDPGNGEPTKPPPDGEPVDPREKLIAMVKHHSIDKPHVLLWKIKGYNKVPAEDGGPYPIMEHQPQDVRIRIPNETWCAFLAKEQRADGGKILFEILGYGVDIEKELLDGQKLYVEKIDVR